eukprot:5717437-Pyramimonas_sp.AAC.1
MFGPLRYPRTRATHPGNPRKSLGIRGNPETSPELPGNPSQTGGPALQDRAILNFSRLHEPWGTPLRAEGTVWWRIHSGLEDRSLESVE